MCTGYSTPVYSHAGRGRFRDVYEPAEDSFLLIDALEIDAQRLQLMSCTDVNPAAAQCTEKTASCNNVSLQPVITDLVECLLSRLSGKVDVLLFNPPYVVTPSEEVGSRGIEAAWAGGKRGREVTDRFLPLVPQLLSPKGLFYLITVAENDPDEIINLLGKHGLKGESCLSTRAGNERLSVLRFHRSQT
ncbi:hemK methyltransferase family member 2 isoform X2 [Seriola lalandi dorsalis]|uniref:hemK methyltransferase family member 2 isoform X2 n=1 Tax=Seriola lalandi dorsalis TaxID=1841481 RepID=UPI000C6F4880|nr:hemK methyltransferase family member 2 isoform X2 [Seriola lalandi dorsalis]XP_056226827.1 methyltransferase N6AMT1 isoform X2 [Seriola aureovittata]